MMEKKQWILFGPRSRARDWVNIRWAALAVAKPTVIGFPRRAAVAPVTAITPSPLAVILGPTCCATVRRPCTFVFIDISNFPRGHLGSNVLCHGEKAVHVRLHRHLQLPSRSSW